MAAWRHTWRRLMIELRSKNIVYCLHKSVCFISGWRRQMRRSWELNLRIWLKIIKIKIKILRVGRSGAIVMKSFHPRWSFIEDCLKIIHLFCIVKTEIESWNIKFLCACLLRKFSFFTVTLEIENKDAQHWIWLLIKIKLAFTYKQYYRNKHCTMLNTFQHPPFNSWVIYSRSA